MAIPYEKECLSLKGFHILILSLLFSGIMPIHAHAGETVFPDTTAEMVLIPGGEFIMGGS